MEQLDEAPGLCINNFVPSNTSGRPVVRWIQDGAKYRETLEAGELPVIAPGDPGELAKRTEVLKWYADPQAGPRRRAVSAADLIVSLSPEFDAPLELFAEREHRSFLPGARLGNISALVKRADPRSVLIFGRAELFSRVALLQLGGGLDIPWGVLPARNISALTFLLAKLAMAGPAGGQSGFADAVDGHFYSWPGPGAVPTHAALEAETLRLLPKTDWQSLYLLAHGEGGHLNLHPLVLCGLLGEAELSTAGHEVPGGCRRLAGGDLCCKRQRADSHAVGYGALRAQDLAVFSCSSYPVAAEPYPSQVSGVLAALEGYPVSVLATDRVMEVDPIEPVLGMTVFHQTGALGAVAQALNDIQFRRLGARPYLLFGDPAGETALPPATVHQGEVQTGPAGRVSVLDQPAPAGRRGVLALSGTDDQILTGARRVYLWPARRPGPGSRLTDVTAAVEQSATWLQTIARRLNRAAMLEAAVPAQLAMRDADTAQDMSTLRYVRLCLEETVQSCLTYTDRSLLHGVCEPRLESLSERLRVQLAAWDRTCAVLLKRRLLGSIFDAAVWGQRTAATSSPGVCDGCGTGLVALRATMPAGSPPDQWRTDCPVCGEHELWREGGSRLMLSALPPLRRGVTVPLTISQRDSAGAARSRTGEDTADGFLVVEARDVGRGRGFLSTVRPSSGQPVQIEVPVPGDLTCELHTLRVAWVRNLDVSSRRWRWALNPPVDA